MKRLFLILTLSFFAVSCQNAGQEEGGDTQTDTEQNREAETGQEGLTNENENNITTTTTATGQDVTLNLYTVGEQMTTMQFEPTRLEVPAGSNVTIKLINKAKSEAMIHNAVFIEAGKQEAVVEEALKAGPEKDYTPESPFIIASTSLAKP